VTTGVQFLRRGSNEKCLVRGTARLWRKAWPAAFAAERKNAPATRWRQPQSRSPAGRRHRSQRDETEVIESAAGCRRKAMPTLGTAAAPRGTAACLEVTGKVAGRPSPVHSAICPLSRRAPGALSCLPAGAHGGFDSPTKGRRAHVRKRAGFYSHPQGPTPLPMRGNRRSRPVTTTRGYAWNCSHCCRRPS